jgi:hypothetical protein
MNDYNDISEFDKAYNRCWATAEEFSFSDDKLRFFIKIWLYFILTFVSLCCKNISKVSLCPSEDA